MKMYLISDNIDTLIGMRLAGIDGCVVHEADETVNAVKKAVSEKEIGVLLMTEKAASKAKSYVGELKLTLHTPLIVEIPDRHGSRDIAGSIEGLVQESIGLKL